MMKLRRSSFSSNHRAIIGHARTRRFPPPWTIEERNDACFIVRDTNGQGLGYFYFEEEPGRRSAANLPTRDGAKEVRRSVPLRTAN
jgi:hypothetical protein